MAMKVFIRLAGLEDQEQPVPFSIQSSAKWTAVQQLLASYYGDICPDNLDVRYWDDEDYVILSSQEELEEAIRLSEDNSYLQLCVRLMDPTDSSSANRQADIGSSVDGTIAAQSGGKSLEETPQRRASKARNLDFCTQDNSQLPGLEEAENFQSTLDTAPGQQNTMDVGGATAIEFEEEKPVSMPRKSLKKTILKLAGENETDGNHLEGSQMLDYCLKYLEEVKGINTGGASQADARVLEREQVDEMMELMQSNLLEAAKGGEDFAEQEPFMLPGALSGANAIAIEMPEMEHHGTETAEPAEIAETGEVSTESSRDAETGFWMQPRLEAEVSRNRRDKIEKQKASRRYQDDALRRYFGQIGQEPGMLGRKNTIQVPRVPVLLNPRVKRHKAGIADFITKTNNQAELKRRLSTLMTEREHSQHSHPPKKHEHRSSRKDKKKKHPAAETSSEDTDYQKKQAKSSSSHASSSLLELEPVLKGESSSDSPPPLLLPSKKHERRSSHKSDSKKKKHSTDPLTEDSFIRYMTKFEAQLRKDMAKDVAKKTVHGVIKNFPKQSEGSETASNPPAISTKRAGCVHEDIICDCCDREIVGTRYICGNCPNYDLCAECENIQPSFHDRTHVFIKLRRPCLKAGTRHGVRASLLKRVIYDTKEEERKVDPDRLQVILEHMKGQEGRQSRNNNNDGGGGEGEEGNGQQTRPSPQEEEQEQVQEQLDQTEQHSRSVCKADLIEATGSVDGSVFFDVFGNQRTSVPVPLVLTTNTEPLENKEGESDFAQLRSDCTDLSLMKLIVAGYGCEDPTASMLPDHSSLRMRNPAEEEESVWVPAVKPKQQWIKEVLKTEPRTQDDGSEEDEDADDHDPEVNYEDDFVVCPSVQSCTEEQETCTEEKFVDLPPGRETSPVSSIEVVDTQSPTVSPTATTCHHCISQPPRELSGWPLYPLEECEKKEIEGIVSSSCNEWLNRNHSDIQEESEDASSFTSLSDVVSGDEDFVVITPDCFDTSKPLDPNRFSMMCKKAQKWNAAGNEQKEDEAHSKEEEASFSKQEGEPLIHKLEDETLSDEQKEEEAGLDIPPPAAVLNRSVKDFFASKTSPDIVHLVTPKEMEKAVWCSSAETLDDANGNGAAENAQNTHLEDKPSSSSTVREMKKDAGEEEEEQGTTLPAEVEMPDVNQNTAAASHSTPEKEEPEVQNRSLADSTDEDSDDDDDVDVEETDLKRFPQSDEEGAAAAADSLDPNQQLNQMMTNTLKKASSGLHTLYQTGKDIFKTLQQGESYEFKESSYEHKPSDYKLPESTWQPSSTEYVPPQSNFQMVKSEFQLPKSSYRGPQSQVPAGVGLGGEYAGPLQRIREMGYFNNQHILTLLTKHAGDVQKVVNDLVEETDNNWADERHGVDRS